MNTNQARVVSCDVFRSAVAAAAAATVVVQMTRGETRRRSTARRPFARTTWRTGKVWSGRRRSDGRGEGEIRQSGRQLSQTMENTGMRR